MRADIRWTLRTKQSISLRLARGYTASQIKASFNKLVDSIAEDSVSKEDLQRKVAELEKMLEAATRRKKS